MPRVDDDVALDVFDDDRDDARPRARPARRHRRAAAFLWVLALCSVATLSLSLSRSGAVVGAGGTSARRLLGVYFQRRAAGSVGRLRAAHGFSASDGVARTARSANWVGDEIGRHVTFKAGSVGPIPETQSAAGSDSGWQMSEDDDEEEEKKTSTALVVVESQVAADGASGDVPSSSAEKRVTSALETLGLEKGATRAEAKKAYLNMARKWHPDKNLGEKQAEATEKFKKIKEAWDVLDAALQTPDDSGGGGGGGGGSGGGGGAAGGAITQ